MIERAHYIIGIIYYSLLEQPMQTCKSHTKKATDSDWSRLPPNQHQFEIPFSERGNISYAYFDMK